MKKLISLSIIIIAVVIGLFLGKEKANPLPLTQIPKHVLSTTAPTAEPVSVAAPKELIIPAISIDATVESVAQDSEGRMDVPKHNEDVAWYNPGTKPGQLGSAVIDGHLDTVTGAPAVFWNIAKLHKGDQLIVVDSNNIKHTFSVTDVESYSYNQLPLEQIFNAKDAPRLNLITCGGTWDQTSHNYSNRTVVYAVLQ